MYLRMISIEGEGMLGGFMLGGFIQSEFVTNVNELV
jgi:hypothetical protein